MDQELGTEKMLPFICEPDIFLLFTQLKPFSIVGPFCTISSSMSPLFLYPHIVSTLHSHNLLYLEPVPCSLSTVHQRNLGLANRLRHSIPSAVDATALPRPTPTACGLQDCADECVLCSTVHASHTKYLIVLIGNCVLQIVTSARM